MTISKIQLVHRGALRRLIAALSSALHGGAKGAASRLAGCVQCNVARFC